MTESGTGTGFISNGIILTASHVVSGRNQISVQIFNEVLNAKVLHEDRQRDIAVIKVEMNEYQSRLFGMLGNIPLGDSDKVEIGEDVVEIGNSLGLGITVSNGIISAFKNFKGEKRFQTTSPTSPGNSGSPLINSQDECIGIITSQIKEGQNLNFAVPINYAKKLLNGGK